MRKLYRTDHLRYLTRSVCYTIYAIGKSVTLPLFMFFFKTKCLLLCSLTFVCTLFSVAELHIPVEKKNFSSIYWMLL